MALSSADKTKIRRFLGYADVTQGYYSTLEGVMNSISADGETAIGVILTDLDTIETTLRSSWSRQKVTKAEEVTLAGPGEIRALRSEGDRLVENLGSVLGVSPARAYFSNTGARGGVARRGA